MIQDIKTININLKLGSALGSQVANIYQEKAIKHLTEGADDLEMRIKQIIEEYKAAGRRSELQKVIRQMHKTQQNAAPTLPAELCYVEGEAREHYCSAPHGAGRILSRSQAHERITLEDFESSMRGIYSESVNEFTRDEAPMVYKPAEAIIDNIGDTVAIETVVRPIFNFKAM